MLSVRGLSAGYGGGTVLHGVDLDVPDGAVLALVGRNGAGKSTLVHTVAGLLRPYAGTVTIDGRDLTGRPAHRVARAGVALVPQGRRVFRGLTVAEHLTLAAGSGRRGGIARHRGGLAERGRRDAAVWTAAGVLELMPRLAERLRHRGNQLSGGEQQMLAIGRALLTQPTVLLLDEPCEGLAGEVAARVRDLVADLAATGLSVLLVEQQLDRAVAVADRVAALDYGRVAVDAPSAQVRARPAAVEAVLGVTPGPPTTSSDRPGMTALVCRPQAVLSQGG